MPEKRTRTPAKYSPATVEKICAIIRKDTYSIGEMCKKVGIARRTWSSWMQKYPEFKEAVEKAKEDFTETTLVECSRSLRKLIKGYSYIEKKEVKEDTGMVDENDKPVMKVIELTETTKRVAPNLGAIIHYQTNKDPENWRNRQSTELTGKGGKDLIPAARILTRAEAAELLKQLENDL